VGGELGRLLATILKANPKLKGGPFDQPSVIAHAQKDRHVTAQGIADAARSNHGASSRPCRPAAMLTS
jgi:hypothetical protein